MKIMKIEPIFLAVLSLHFPNFFASNFYGRGIEDICRVKFTGATSGGHGRTICARRRKTADTTKENSSTRRKEFGIRHNIENSDDKGSNNQEKQVHQHP